MSQESSDTRELWSFPTCARYLRLSENALRCRMKRGQFPRETYVYIGRSIRFVAERVKQWIFKQTG